MTTEQHRDLLLKLEAMIILRAKSLGIISFRDDELSKEKVFSKVKAAKIFSKDIDENQYSIPLPEERVILRVGNYTVLLTSIVFAEESIERTFEIALLWAAMIRSHLSSGTEDDIHLVFVGPPNVDNIDYSSAKSEWIEQDERFCRKLVFLREPEKTLYESINDFLERTFLSRPWESDGEKMQTELDAVAAFSKSVSHDYFSSEIIASWIRTAGKGDLVGRDLASAILKIYEKEP